ncbi:MAG: sigma-54 dependent transcriptional regulator [Fuerstiella sp.]|nr:sigma-54 dependent transcriptional regulator [Fuerstiella sp.]
MESSEFLVMCSGQPGFLRNVGTQLAGKCRLLECYSLTEAAQMVQLHRPTVALIDLRQGVPQQFDRSWAMAHNSNTTFLVIVTNINELDLSHVPAEIVDRVVHVQTDTATGDLSHVILATEELLSGNCPNMAVTANDQTYAVDLPQAVETAGLFSGVTPQFPFDLTERRTLKSGPLTENRIADFAMNDEPSVGSVQPIADRYRTRTPGLRQMLERLEVAAKHNVTMLLIGETGVGKTHLARLIHESSQRRDEPLLTVPCGALPGELIESELFGHVKGAFTSAHAAKDGKFLAAGRGTILLDEIDVLAPEQQVKLLRVIEKGLFEPVGSNETLKVEARIIAASNLELQPLVEQGRFRPDLYYRLNTLSFRIPPLRQRLPDIEPLARYFVHLHAEKHGIDVVEISDQLINSLVSYPWPGNIREMENAIRSAVIYSNDGKLTVDTLPPNIVEGAAGPSNNASVASFFSGKRGASLGNRIELTEKDIIEQALMDNSFNRTKTAKQLGISRVTLYNKMKKYDMMPKD